MHIFTSSTCFNFVSVTRLNVRFVHKIVKQYEVNISTVYAQKVFAKVATPISKFEPVSGCAIAAQVGGSST